MKHNTGTAEQNTGTDIGQMAERKQCSFWTVVDKERMKLFRPGQWLVSMLLVSFSALMLMVGIMKGIWRVKNITSQTFSSRVISK